MKWEGLIKMSARGHGKRSSDYDPKKCQRFPAVFRCLGSGPWSYQHPLLGTAALTPGRDYINVEMSTADTLQLGRVIHSFGVPSFVTADDR